jgi:uncharacterized C2H2 Zn-finger protein
MSRLAAWCPQGAKLFTSEDLRLREEDGARVLGYRCPRCGRVVQASEWKDSNRVANGDSRGWVGTSGMRWPRHYSWAQGMKKR